MIITFYDAPRIYATPDLATSRLDHRVAANDGKRNTILQRRSSQGQHKGHHKGQQKGQHKVVTMSTEDVARSHAEGEIRDLDAAAPGLVPSFATRGQHRLTLSFFWCLFSSSSSQSGNS